MVDIRQNVYLFVNRKRQQRLLGFVTRRFIKQCVDMEVNAVFNRVIATAEKCNDKRDDARPN